MLAIFGMLFNSILGKIVAEFFVAVYRTLLSEVSQVSNGNEYIDMEHRLLELLEAKSSFSSRIPRGTLVI